MESVAGRIVRVLGAYPMYRAIRESSRSFVAESGTDRRKRPPVSDIVLMDVP
jgi:hypothetical protein